MSSFVGEGVDQSTWNLGRGPGVSGAFFAAAKERTRHRIVEGGDGERRLGPHDSLPEETSHLVLVGVPNFDLLRWTWQDGHQTRFVWGALSAH